MNDAGHVATMLGADHQHEAAVALGDDFVLQVFRAASASVLLERPAQLLPLLAELVANALQLGACAVEHLAARIDRVANGVDFALERGDVRDQRAKNREVVAGA